MGKEIQTVQLFVTLEKVGEEKFRAWAGVGEDDMDWTGEGYDGMSALKALAEDLAQDSELRSVK